MAIPFSGGCACGAIRYESAAEPLVAGHCQCRDCQRDSGTGHASHLMLPRAAFKLTGNVKYYESKADSGNLVSRGFCPNCGSPVVSKNSGMPDLVFVRAASLDDPGLFKPSLVVYASSSQPWDYVDPALPKFPKMPPM